MAPVRGPGEFVREGRAAVCLSPQAVLAGIILSNVVPYLEAIYNLPTLWRQDQYECVSSTPQRGWGRVGSRAARAELQAGVRGRGPQKEARHCGTNLESQAGKAKAEVLLGLAGLQPSLQGPPSQRETQFQKTNSFWPPHADIHTYGHHANMSTHTYTK